MLWEIALQSYGIKKLCVRMRTRIRRRACCKQYVLFFAEKMLTNQQDERIIRLVDLSTR